MKPAVIVSRPAVERLSGRPQPIGTEGVLYCSISKMCLFSVEKKLICVQSVEERKGFDTICAYLVSRHVCWSWEVFQFGLGLLVLKGI